LGKVVWSTLASMEDGKMGHGQKNVELNISWPKKLDDTGKWGFLSCEVPVKSRRDGTGQRRKKKIEPTLPPNTKPQKEK
jgi:hypothetical protein